MDWKEKRIQQLALEEVISMDDRLFKAAMGKFATGVTVVLTKWENDNHGMTANAFMSVSLEPKLIVVSIANKARMKPIIEQSGNYSVNILATGHEELSMHFAGQKELAHVDFSEFAGIPAIKGAIATIACDVHDTVVQGDHTLFFGKVRDVLVTDREPLVYYEGKYKKI